MFGFYMYLVAMIALFKNRHAGALDNVVIRGDITQIFKGNEKWLHLTNQAQCHTWIIT